MDVNKIPSKFCVVLSYIEIVESAVLSSITVSMVFPHVLITYLHINYRADSYVLLQVIFCFIWSLFPDVEHFCSGLTSYIKLRKGCDLYSSNIMNDYIHWR